MFAGGRETRVAETQGQFRHKQRSLYHPKGTPGNTSLALAQPSGLHSSLAPSSLSLLPPVFPHLSFHVFHRAIYSRLDDYYELFILTRAGVNLGEMTPFLVCRRGHYPVGGPRSSPGHGGNERAPSPLVTSWRVVLPSCCDL